MGLIDKAIYGYDVANTLLFLEGKGNILIDQVIANMETAANALDFEQAANFRDQIIKLRLVMEQHFIEGERGDVDIIACATKANLACIQVFFIRNGQHLGNKAFFPKMTDENDPGAVIQAFIAQYYFDKPVPHEFIVSHELEDSALLSEVLSVQAKHAVTISPRVRGERLKWLQMAGVNAENALQEQLANRQDSYALFLSLQNALGIAFVPQRLECFDISHTQGQQTVASCGI